MGFAYVGIRVTELERSFRFYTRGLGLVEADRGTMAQGGQWVALRDPVTNAELELNYYPPGHPYATAYVPGEGLDHLGFQVHDARATVERLRTMGARVAVEPWLEEGRCWIGFVEDPDGLWVELESPARGTAPAPTAPSAPS